MVRRSLMADVNVITVEGYHDFDAAGLWFSGLSSKSTSEEMLRHLRDAGDIPQSVHAHILKVDADHDLVEVWYTFEAYKAVCDDCGFTFWSGDRLAEISDLAERLDPCGEVPVAACPECGALAYAWKRGE
jgi:hypothetical protein